MSEPMNIRSVRLADDGTFPNHGDLPLLLYTGGFPDLGTDPPCTVESQFTRNAWPAAWRNGVYGFHHYHSNAHEVLGVYRGHARIQFGGPAGPVLAVTTGDAVLLPAGTAHKLVDSSADFAVVGAYPPGQRPDLCRGEPSERPRADRHIRNVPLPSTDPVLGSAGGLVAHWSARGEGT